MAQKSKGILTIALLLLVFASVMCFERPSVFVRMMDLERPVSASMPPYWIAYVYNDSITTANNFRSFLHDDNGFQVTLVNMSRMGSINFNVYAVVIIGEDTGLPNMNAWNNGTALSKINSSIAPIIGIGNGGYMFFKRLGLHIGINEWGYAQGTTTLLSSFNSEFPGPYNITTGDKTMSATNPNVREVYYGGALPANTTAYAMHVGDSHHYSIVQETSHYLLWGFSATPDQMSETAKQMFINIISTKINYGYLTVSHPSDITFVHGQTNYVLWTINDIFSATYPRNYSIFQDGNPTTVSSYIWINDVQVAYSLGNLTPGVYQIEIRALDGYDGWVSDSVLVMVIGGILNITNPADITYGQGQTGNTISWTITGITAGLTKNYSIYRDTTLMATGNWTSGNPVTYSVDGLALGTYNITIIAQDGIVANGNDTVKVTVVPLPPTIPASDPFMIVLLSCVTMVMILVISKKKLRTT